MYHRQSATAKAAHGVRVLWNSKRGSSADLEPFSAAGEGVHRVVGGVARTQEGWENAKAGWGGKRWFGFGRHVMSAYEEQRKRKRVRERERGSTRAILIQSNARGVERREW